MMRCVGDCVKGYKGVFAHSSAVLRTSLDGLLTCDEAKRMRRWQ